MLFQIIFVFLQPETKDVKIMNKNEQFVITINREVGSGGRTVGRKLAEKLDVKYFDKAIVDGLTKQFGLSIERIEEIKSQKKSWWNDINNYYNTLVNSANLPMEAEVKLDNETMFATEKHILQELASHSSCVIAGRTGFMVFREWPNHLQEARDIIKRLDAGRETYIKKYENTSRYDTRNYDLVLSMDGKTEDEIVDVILKYIG